MKRKLALSLAFLSLALAVHAADDPGGKIKELYRKHLYWQAATAFYGTLATGADEVDAAAALGFAMICLENARLHRDLHHLSVLIHMDYLTRLISDEEQAGSRLVSLYLGRTLLQAGEYAEAAAFLTQFLNAESSSPENRHLAQTSLGTAFFRQGDTAKAAGIWEGVFDGAETTAVPRAAAVNAAGMAERLSAGVCSEVLPRPENDSKQPSMWAATQALGVYADGGCLDEGFRLLGRTDFTRFFHKEVPSENKIIYFYDPALLENLSRFFSRAALPYLQQAAEASDERVAAAARFQLAGNLCAFGLPGKALTLVDALMADDRMPSAVKPHLQVMAVSAHHRNGDRKGVEAILEDLLSAPPDDELTAELLLTCCRNRIDSPRLAVTASTLAQSVRERSSARLNYVLGKYFLQKKDYVKAVEFLESGRNKSKKNRLEYNDPLMLVDLAEVYYRTRKYSEALEILFELGKHFPAVRQIQVALQGVYSMEQQSAGDARIF